MKTAVSLILGITSTVAFADPGSEYVNIVRQIQQDTNTEWDVTVAAAGNMASSEGVGPLGSTFELWTTHSTTGVATELDSKFVSAYTPSATISIVTGDTNATEPRTRVDKGFTVNMTVSGLLAPGTDIPEAATKVEFDHTLANYPEGQHGFGNTAARWTSQNSYDITQNGTTQLTYSVSNLTGTDLTKVEGEEVFNISSYADGIFPAETLDEKKVVIWPMASAEIKGIETGQSYSILPPITVELTDLYPDSTTFVRVYQGDASSDPANAVNVNSASVVIDDATPQDRTMTLSALDSYMASAGTWTVEVLHTTPWGTEVLTYKSPSVSRTIKVRAGIYSTK